MQKSFYSNLGCLIYTDKNYMKPFVITENKKSHIKDLFYDTSIEGVL